MKTNIRDRIVELRRVRAGELQPNPRNWRRHPKRQREALRALLSEVGFADAILARELEDGSLEIVDGHLRQSMNAEAIVPVLILDVDRDEADKLLATLDPLAAMAIADPELLRALLESVETSSEDVRLLLAGLATAADVDARLGLVDPPSALRQPVKVVGKRFGYKNAPAVRIRFQLGLEVRQHSFP